MADSLETIAAKNQQKLAYNQAMLEQKAQAAQALQEIQLAGKQQQIDPSNIFAGLSGNTKANNNPLIGAFDAYLAQEQAQNPYLNTARNVSQARAPQGSGLMDQLLFSFAQGALTGGLNEYGQNDIGSTLREDLPPQLATIYPERDFSSVFGDEDTSINPLLMRAQLIDALGDEENNQALQLAGLKGALGGKGGGLGAARPNITIDKDGNVQVSRPNPTSGALPGVEDVRKARSSVPSALDEISQILGTTEEYGAVDQPSVEAQTENGPISLDDAYTLLKASGLGETTTTARMRGPQRRFDDAVTKGIPGAFEASSDFASKARLIRQGIEDFGDTGPLYGPAKKSLMSVLDATGLDDVLGVDADKTLRGAQAFDVSAWKEAFLNKMPGAITEKELDKMLNLGGGIGSSNLTNERLAQAAEKLSVIADAYGKAQEKYIADNGTMTGFDGKWAAQKRKLMGAVQENSDTKTPEIKEDKFEIRTLPNGKKVKVRLGH